MSANVFLTFGVKQEPSVSMIVGIGENEIWTASADGLGNRRFRSGPVNGISFRRVEIEEGIPQPYFRRNRPEKMIGQDVMLRDLHARNFAVRTAAPINVYFGHAAVKNPGVGPGVDV